MTTDSRQKIDKLIKQDRQTERNIKTDTKQNKYREKQADNSRNNYVD